MKKFKEILRLTALGLALYFTVSNMAYMGVIALCKAIYPQNGDGLFIKWIADGLMRTDPVTMRIMVVIIVISAVGDFGHFFQFLFDVIVGWGVMAIWHLLKFPIPELWQGLLCDVTLAIFATACFTVLVEIKFSRKKLHAKRQEADDDADEEEPSEEDNQEGTN